jgi:hypothetical protein
MYRWVRLDRLPGHLANSSTTRRRQRASCAGENGLRTRKKPGCSANSNTVAIVSFLALALVLVLGLALVVLVLVVEASSGAER